jgi:hypothetical protein
MGGGIRGSRSSIQAVRSNHKALSSYSGANIGKRVFISFHIEDESRVNLLRHQAKDDKFDLEFVDYSVKEPFDEKWKTQCAERIAQSSVVVCMIGPETYKREAVLWEVNKAYELGKKVIGIRISRDRNDPIPEPLLQNHAKIIYWNLEDIQHEIDKK